MSSGSTGSSKTESTNISEGETYTCSNRNVIMSCGFLVHLELILFLLVK